MHNTPINSTLELPPEEMRALGYQVVDMLVDHLEGLPDRPTITTQTANRPAMEARFRTPIPEQGSDVKDLLDVFQREVVNEIYYRDHPRDFSFVPSPGNFVSVLADTLASGFNIFAGAWVSSPAATMIELVTIDWLRQIYGLPETAGGIFTSGGSMANMTGLAVARHIKLDDRLDGAMAYCSDQTHASVAKGLRLLGFLPEQLRKLPSDDDFRLNMDGLREAVAADRAAGKKPFCVIASAGTTNTGTVDPLPEIAAFCRKEDLWLHIDGAYGAAGILAEKGQTLLEGIQYADSLASDPHKWLFQPYEMGCVLVRDQHHLRETFSVSAEYLKDIVDPAQEEINLYDYGMQMSRSFRALKLWMSIKAFGMEAFRQAVSRGIELAELAEGTLRAAPHWEIVTPAQLGVVTFCYRLPGQSDAEVEAINHGIVEKMKADGYAMVISTTLKGRTVLRMVTINPRTTDDDITQTIHKLEQFGQEFASCSH